MRMRETRAAKRRDRQEDLKKKREDQKVKRQMAKAALRSLRHWHVFVYKLLCLLELVGRLHPAAAGLRDRTPAPPPRFVLGMS